MACWPDDGAFSCQLSLSVVRRDKKTENRLKTKDLRQADQLYLKEGDLEKFNLTCKNIRLFNKRATLRKPFLDDARVILVAYGTMARIARARSRLRKRQEAGLIRPITLWPFPQKHLPNT